MDHHFKLLIDGKLVDGADTSPVINPATGKSFADRPVASREQLDQAVRAAKAAQPAWAARPIDERRDVLRAIADRIEAATGDLAHLLTLEGGKPLRDSKAEISLFVATIREVASIDLAVEVIEDSDSNRVEAHFRPYGVVAAIVPWNFPIGLIGNKLPPALLVGNTLVVRPASSTPLSAVLMGEIIADVVPPADLAGFLLRIQMSRRSASPDRLRPASA
jgi:acyl-CoA reductase-like NAD-dependent aldehyde dehydrogenase